MKKQLYILVLVSISLIQIACKSNKIQGEYSSHYQEVKRKYFFNGPVHNSRSIFMIYDEAKIEISEDSILLYEAIFKIDAIENLGYKEFTKEGMQLKHYPLYDSINQTLAHDTLVLVSKKGYKIRAFKKEYFPKDVAKKLRYKQQFLIKKHVFNPYRVYFNKRTVEPYKVVVKKDSTYKEQTYTYSYKLNKNGTMHQETGKILWDRDLDGVTDKETITFIATYNYNDKNQLVSKDFEFGPLLSKYPDHGLDFYDTSYLPKEEYTYDAAGNLTSVYTYTTYEGQKVGLVFSEDYTYDENNNLIKLKRRASGGLSINRHFKRTNEFFFNEKEEVVKVISYENDEKTVHATYKMEYLGHDIYDNWTKCYHYLNGSKKPYGETNRKFEYYNK